MSLSPKVFWFVIAVFVAARLVFAAVNYRGDTSAESRQRALRVFDRSEVQAGLEYHRTGFGVAVAWFLVTVAALLWLTLGGVSLRLARWSLDVSGGRVWLQTLIYLGVLVTVAWVAGLPQRYYLGHVIESRFGFTNMSGREWIVFQLKQFVVAGVMVLVVGSAGYALVRAFPRAWALIVPGAALVFQLVMIVVFPKLLLPIFYKVEPVSDPALVSELREVAHRAGVELTNVRMIDASRYSSHTNAFFTGFGKFKEIYLFDTLVKDHTPEEVGAILAHELGHWKRNHVLKGTFLSVMGMLAAALLLQKFFPALARAPFLNIGPLEDVSALPALLLIAMIAAFFTSPVESGISRWFEREADEIGIALTEAPDVFIRDFKRLAQTNKSNLLPHPLIVTWSYSHPPLLERIETIERGIAEKEERRPK